MKEKQNLRFLITISILLLSHCTLKDAAKFNQNNLLLPTSIIASGDISNPKITPRVKLNSNARSNTSKSIKEASVPPSPAVRILLEIVPQASPALCEWVLNTKCMGNVTEASMFLIECKDIEALDLHRVELLAKLKREEARNANEAAKLEKAMRKSTLTRYDMDPEKYNAKLSRPVPNSHDGRRFGKLKSQKKKGEMEHRWVDGKQVKVRKGSTKILVESRAQASKQEWDGGSTGRVIRKSQRLNARR